MDLDGFLLVAWPPFGLWFIRGLSTYPDQGADLSNGACFIRVKALSRASKNNQKWCISENLLPPNPDPKYFKKFPLKVLMVSGGIFKP